MQNKQDGLKFEVTFWMLVWAIFYKFYHKISLALSKKRYGSIYYILCCSSWGKRGDSLKNHHHFEKHIPVQTWENVIGSYTKNVEQINSN